VKRYQRWRYLLLVAVALYLATGLKQVRPEERAVVFRFGKIVAYPSPGLWLSWPYGIDRIEKIDVSRSQSLVVGFRYDDPREEIPGQYLTGDQNLVNVQVNVEYGVGTTDEDLANWLQNRGLRTEIIQRECEALLVQWSSSGQIDELLLTGSATVPAYITQQLQARLEDKKLGVKIRQCSVAIIAPPEEVRTAFEEVNRADTNRQTQKNKAREEATRKISDAKSEADRLRSQAKSYSTSREKIARAESDVFSKRLMQYRGLQAQNPNLTNAIWWEEMGPVWKALGMRGRVLPLDPLIGPDGIDISTIIPPSKK